jgi:urea transporter
MADGSTSGLYGYVSLLIGALVAVLVAKISRDQREDEPDLTTIAGLAAELVSVRERVEAHGRYMGTLQAALVAAGVPVPEPAEADARLIR